VKLACHAKKHGVRGDEQDNRQCERPPASANVVSFHQLHRWLGQYELKTAYANRTLIDCVEAGLTE
jgi:hypothetical protein